MLYRKVTVADAPCFVESRKILLMREDDRSIDDTLAEYFAKGLSDNALIAWVAEDNSQIVSTVCLCICPLVPRFDNPAGKIAYLINMYTTPNYRGQGVASNLMREAINDVKAHSTDMAKSIYAKLGFTKGRGSPSCSF